MYFIVSGFYRKVPKFSDADLPKIKQGGQTLRFFLKKDANGIGNSEDPDHRLLLLLKEQSDLGLH